MHQTGIYKYYTVEIGLVQIKELFREIGPRKQNYDIKRFLFDLTEPGFEPIFDIKDLGTLVKLQ